MWEAESINERKRTINERYEKYVFSECYQGLLVETLLYEVYDDRNR